jgi:hypothetical protein
LRVIVSVGTHRFVANRTARDVALTCGTEVWLGFNAADAVLLRDVA